MIFNQKNRGLKAPITLNISNLFSNNKKARITITITKNKGVNN